MMKKIRILSAGLAAVAFSLLLCSCLKVSVEVVLPTNRTVSETLSSSAVSSTQPESGSEPSAVSQLQEPLTDEPISLTTSVYEQTLSTAPTEQTAGTPEVTNAPEVTSAPETKAPVTDAPTQKTPDQMTAEEALAYFNRVLNEVKTQKLGVTKSKITVIDRLELSNAGVTKIANTVKNMFLSDKPTVTKVKKGESSVNVVSPSGKSFVSSLTPADVASVKTERSGANYVITVNMKDIVNPDSSGPFGKVFDFMTVDEIMNDYAPKIGAKVAREDIKLAFYNCYARLTVSPEGRAVSYQTYVKGGMDLKNAKVTVLTTDVSVVLASTTDYTDFIY